MSMNDFHKSFHTKSDLKDNLNRGESKHYIPNSPVAEHVIMEKETASKYDFHDNNNGINLIDIQ